MLEQHNKIHKDLNSILRVAKRLKPLMFSAGDKSTTRPQEFTDYSPIKSHKLSFQKGKNSLILAKFKAWLCG